MSPVDPTIAGVPLLTISPTQGREAPLHTFTRLNKEAGIGPYERVEVPVALIGGMLAVAVLMAILAWRINHRANNRPPAAERAFDRLAKQLNLGGPARKLVHQIAGATGYEPLSLLVSPGLMANALEHPDRSTWREQPGWARVRTLAG